MIPGTTELDAVINIFATVENLELTPELREGLTAKTLARFISNKTEGGKTNGND